MAVASWMASGVFILSAAFNSEAFWAISNLPALTLHPIRYKFLFVGEIKV
jgi:hypothetical protein